MRDGNIRQCILSGDDVMLNFLRRLLGLPIKPSLRKVSEEVKQNKEADLLQGLVVRISESALEGNSHHFLVEVEQLRDNINVEWGEHIDARYSVL